MQASQSGVAGGSRPSSQAGPFEPPGLPSLGADEVVSLTGDGDATGRALGAAASEADIVLDSLWGKPAQHAITALLTARSDRTPEESPPGW